MMNFSKKQLHFFKFKKLSVPKGKISAEMSLDQLVSFIFLYKLKLDSLPGSYFFIDKDCLSCAMQLNFIGWWHLLLDFHWFLTVRFDQSDYKLLVIGEFRSYNSKLES